MPLEPPDRQHCDAALGFSELGMFWDAEAEHEKIDPFNRAAPEVLRVTASVYHGTAKWEDLPSFIPFNLACYYCQLGDLEGAKDSLKQAFAIDPSWRLAALEDDDLEPLWSFLSEEAR